MNKCLQKVLRMIGLLCKIATPCLSALMGLTLANSFDVFALFPLPNNVSSYDICITVYFAIFDIIFALIADWIKRHLISQKIEISIYTPESIPAIETKPILVLHNDKPSEIRIRVSMSIKKSVCRNLKVKIAAINFATMQLPKASGVAMIDDDGNYILDIEKLCGQQEQVKTSQDFRLLFVQEPIEGVSEVEIYPELSKEKIRIDYSHNKAFIKAGVL